MELAQEINGRMPRYVVERSLHLLNRAGRTLEGARVLLLGVTYKADIADERESPARRVAAGLRRLGADVVFHDPYVQRWTVDGTDVPRVDPATGSAEADLTILLQDHGGYDLEAIGTTANLLLDTRGKAPRRANVEAL